MNAPEPQNPFAAPPGAAPPPYAPASGSAYGPPQTPPQAGPSWSSGQYAAAPPGPYAAPWPVAPVGPTAVEHLHRAAWAASQARYQLYGLVAAFALLGVNGILGLITAHETYISDLYETGEGLGGLGVLAFLVSGTWLWALLALYCSHTAQAARLAGNLPSGSSQSSLAWAGVFIPTGILWAPFLAYRTATRYSFALSQHGHRTGAGEGWRQQPPPSSFDLWWGLFAASMAAFGVYSFLPADDYYAANGVFLLLTGAAGVAACVVGVQLWARIAHAAAVAAAGPMR